MKRILLLSFLLPILPASSQVPAISTIYTFTGIPDGATPETPLVRGPNGTLFGSTELGGAYNQGTAFELTPPAVKGQPWTESVIYSFVDGPGGYHPLGLTTGPSGILYGVTTFGGNGHGVVFSLTPPAIPGGLWIESVLFTPTDVYPATSVVVGTDGSLYGGANAISASSHGYFYKLSPPAVGGGAWSFAVLYAFTDQDICTFNGNGLTLGPTGVFYYTGRDLGPYVQAGGVGQLVPPTSQGGSWTNNILYTPRSGSVTSGSVVLAPSGQLYGTTYFGGIDRNGSVFELTPPAGVGGSWTSRLIHQFTEDGAEPSGLFMTPKGDLMGVTVYGSALGTEGSIFVLLASSADSGGWTERIVHEFPSGGTSVGPVGPLVAGPCEAFYGVAGSGEPGGYGTVFQLVR
jgi:hypothetical protein